MIYSNKHLLFLLGMVAFFILLFLSFPIVNVNANQLNCIDDSFEIDFPRLEFPSNNTQLIVCNDDDNETYFFTIPPHTTASVVLTITNDTNDFIDDFWVRLFDEEGNGGSNGRLVSVPPMSTTELVYSGQQIPFLLNSGSTPVSYTLTMAIRDINPSFEYKLELFEPSNLPAIADFAAVTGSFTQDSETGLTYVNMKSDNITPLTIEYSATCLELDDISSIAQELPTNVFLDVVTNGLSTTYTMTKVSSSLFNATIPANLIVDDSNLEVRTICDSGNTKTAEIGSINLYDPSGTITDISTGDLIANATVTIYNVPNWSPKNSPTDNRPNTCESNLSKPSNVTWSQPAPTSLGAIVDPIQGTISPALSFQTTGVDGYYGWDVAPGCWYVTVSADGYETLTSPVVGVPPEVTDLNLELTPFKKVYIPIVIR